MELQNLRDANRLLRQKVKRLERQLSGKNKFQVDNLRRANMALTIALAETKEALVEKQILVYNLLNKK